MDFKELVRKNRSYRRFDGGRAIAREDLVALVALARLTPSGANRQPLRYRLVCGDDCARVFPHLSWAGALRDWDGPEEGQRPTAYIIMLRDGETRGIPADEGIAAQTLLLGATERGMGGCMFGSVKREALAETLALDARYEIALVIALGYPVETVVIEDLPPGGDTAYWRDAAAVHHVPKRTLEELIV